MLSLNSFRNTRMNWVTGVLKGCLTMTVSLLNIHLITEVALCRLKRKQRVSRLPVNARTLFFLGSPVTSDNHRSFISADLTTPFYSQPRLYFPPNQNTLRPIMSSNYFDTLRR